MSERITDERLSELAETTQCLGGEGIIEVEIVDAVMTQDLRDIAIALRELQQWRSGVHPQTGAPIGSFVVMQRWDEETE